MPCSGEVDVLLLLGIVPVIQPMFNTGDLRRKLCRRLTPGLVLLAFRSCEFRIDYKFHRPQKVIRDGIEEFLGNTDQDLDRI